MASLARSSLGQVWAGVRALLVLTVVLGLGYPLLMTAIGQVALNSNADGSLVHHNGAVVGSDLIGQDFTIPVLGPDGKPKLDADGNPVYKPDPMYFQSRPSAAGTGYDPLSSSASNLGPENPELIKLVNERRAAVAKFNGVDPADVPPDALLASGSGLDPQISPAYADIQVPRVARERGMTVSEVQDLVDQNTQGRTLGFLGEPRVNVLKLNLALDNASR
jgi:potassium-transporting ATPase KdpC subunit